MSDQNSYSEPRIPRYPDTILQKAANILSFLAVIFPFLYLLLSWDQIPDTIITHWGFSGQPDGWGSRQTLLILPFISLFLYLPMTVLERFPSVWNVPVKITDENQKWVYQNIKTMLILMKFFMTAMLAYLTVCSARQKDLGALATAVFLAFMFGAMIFFIIRSTRKPPEKYR